MCDPFGKVGTDLASGGYAWIHISGECDHTDQTLVTTVCPGPCWVRGLTVMSGPCLDDEIRRRFSLQEPLSAAAKRNYDAADHGEAKVYAGITLDVEGGRVDVDWQGAPPAAVVSAITVMRESVHLLSDGDPAESGASLRPRVSGCPRWSGSVLQDGHALQPSDGRIPLAGASAAHS